MALALKGYRKDVEIMDERLENVLGVIVDVINNGVYAICKSLGARVKKPQSVLKKTKQPQVSEEPLPLNVVLQQLGGKGVAIEYK